MPPRGANRSVAIELRGADGRHGGARAVCYLATAPGWVRGPRVHAWRSRCTRQARASGAHWNAGAVRGEAWLVAVRIRRLCAARRQGGCQATSGAMRDARGQRTGEGARESARPCEWGAPQSRSCAGLPSSDLPTARFNGAAVAPAACDHRVESVGRMVLSLGATPGRSRAVDCRRREALLGLLVAAPSGPPLRQAPPPPSSPRTPS